MPQEIFPEDSTVGYDSIYSEANLTKSEENSQGTKITKGFISKHNLISITNSR